MPQQPQQEFYASPVPAQAHPVVGQVQPLPFAGPPPTTNLPRPTETEKKCCCACTKATLYVFLVLLCIGGGALIGVGASRFVKHSELYIEIGEYNDYVEEIEQKFPSSSHDQVHGSGHTIRDAFDFGISSITVQQPTSTGPVTTATQFTYPVTPKSAAEGLDSYTSIAYTAIVSNWIAGSPATFTVNSTADNTGSPVSESFADTIPFERVLTEDVHCNHEACSVDCEKEYKRKCLKDQLVDYCTRTYGSEATYSGSETCEDSELCGSCHYPAVLEQACIVMEEKMSKGFSHHIDSCFYPFNKDSQIYAPKLSSTTSNTVKVTFRSAADPFIAMQRITKGTMVFGSDENHAAIGAMLVILGVSLIVIPCCAMCCYRCCTKQHRNKHITVRHVEDGEHTTSHVVMTTYPPATNPVAAPSEPYTTHGVAPPFPRTEGERIFAPRGSESSSQNTVGPDDDVDVEFQPPRKQV